MSTEEKDAYRKGASVQLIHGSMVKSLGRGKFGGFGVYFTSESELDCDGEYFHAQTDFDLEDRKSIPIMLSHGYDPKVGRKRLARASFELQPEGLWTEFRFSLNEPFVRDIETLIEDGKMSFSSAAVPHMTVKKQIGHAKRIDVWPIGEISLTSSPCCAFGTQARVLKAFETYSLQEEMRRRSLTETQLMREQSQEIRARVERTLSLSDNPSTLGEQWKCEERERYARFVSDAGERREARITAAEARERLAKANELLAQVMELEETGKGKEFTAKKLLELKEKEQQLIQQMLRADRLLRDATAAKKAAEGLMRRELRDYVLYAAV
jgi:phage head maturation protease